VLSHEEVFLKLMSGMLECFEGRSNRRFDDPYKDDRMEAQTYENTYVEPAFSKFNLSKRRIENYENWEASGPQFWLQIQWAAWIT
jgi:hypothetical protein